MPDGGALSWREVVGESHSRLVDELAVCLDSERRLAVAQATTAERAKGASEIENLNQIVRRLRSSGEEQVPRLLAEGCAPYATKLVVLVFESSQAGTNQAWVAAGAGTSGENVCFETGAAPAVLAAIESRDRVTAMATAGELSAPLAELFGPESDGQKAYLFPVIA